MKYLTLFLFTLLVSNKTPAQNFYLDKYDTEYIASFGVGPSIIYADNGGRYRMFDFFVTPSADLNLSRAINKHLLIRANYGNQWVKGKKYFDRTNESNDNNQNISFKGTAYLFDLTLTGFLKPYKNIIYRPKINVYGNTGIGWVYMRNISLENEERKMFYTNAAYIPIRIGVLYKLNYKNDIGIEGASLFSFSDKLDGISTSRNINDHFLQFKFNYVKYFTLQ